MRSTILASALVLLSLNGFSQTTSMDSLYIVTYTTGPAWDGAKTPNEQLYFKEHSANLARLRKEGFITAGARYGDKGIIFVKASSLNAAKEIILSDQAVINKLFNAEVQKLNVFYDGCIEKIKPK